MSNKLLYNFLCSKYQEGFNVLHLGNEQFLQLGKELLIDCGNACQFYINIKDSNIYVVNGSQSGKERFYNRKNREKIYLYPIKPIQVVKNNLSKAKEPNAILVNLMTSNFTNGQVYLLHILNKCLHNKEPFTIDKARYIFAKTQKNRPFTVYNHYSEKQQKWISKNYDNGLKVIEELPNYFDYHMKTWIKSNLGSLMMKGALVAIPVIQLGNDALMDLE